MLHSATFLSVVHICRDHVVFGAVYRRASDTRLLCSSENGLGNSGLTAQDWTSEAEREGYMEKKGGTRGRTIIGRKNWTRRWFVLRDGFLYYYVRPPMHAIPDRNGSVAYNCKGIIPIARPNVQVVKSEHHTRKFCFEVQLEGRTFVIDALSETNRDEWMLTMQASIDNRWKETENLQDIPRADLDDVQKALSVLGLEEGSSTQAIYTRYQELSNSSMVALSKQKKGSTETQEIAMRQEAYHDAFVCLSANLADDDMEDLENAEDEKGGTILDEMRSCRGG